MTQATSLAVDLQVVCEDPGIPTGAKTRFWLGRALAAAGTSLARGAEVSVRIVDADEMRALNHEYRKKNTVTNVLSFPAGEITGLPDEAPRALGDIAICAAVVNEEAAAQGKQVADHWAHMLVHGMLHLLGYDHELDAEAAEMEGLETQILVSNGLADPYLTQ